MHALAQIPALHAVRGIVPLAALLLILAEYLTMRWRGVAGYDGRQTFLSLVIFVGGRLFGAATLGVAALPGLLLYQHRLFDIQMTSPLSIAALFLGVEFFYYWHHRAMHGVNWFWISHAVHHSSSKLNLSAALRLGWGANLTGGVVFYLPLIWLGFPPQAVAAMLGAGLFYQFFLHVAAPVSLGPLGLILNSPQSHHVHHACNDACLDRNFGSVLIVFDRLFGSFQKPPEGETLRYGLASAEKEPNLAIIYSGWTRMFDCVRRAGSWSNRLGVLFGPPI